MLHQISLDDFNKAVSSLELLSLTSREDVRRKYLKLSKLYHPDKDGGDIRRFQEVNDAYEILNKYMKNFRFVFDEEEFKRQNPILISDMSEQQIKGKNVKNH